MASAVSDPIDDDLSETCWRDDQWIAAYGLLSPATVLDYFANSPFYDRSCNNEAARQRGLRVEQLAFPGVEFVLQDAQPPHLFVVRKQHRSPAGALSSLTYYYVLDGTIYQAPTLHAALSARMERCMAVVKQAFMELRADLDPLTAAAAGSGALLEAELRREQRAAPQAAQASRDQLQRAQRSVVAALLQHPLPVAAGTLSGRGAAAAAAAAPEAGQAPSQGGTVLAIVPGVVSGGAVSQP